MVVANLMQHKCWAELQSFFLRSGSGSRGGHFLSILAVSQWLHLILDFEKVFSLWWSQDLVPVDFTALAFNGQMCSENVPSVLWNSCERPSKSSVGLFDRCSMGILTYMSDREVDSFGRGGGGRRDEAEQHLFSKHQLLGLLHLHSQSCFLVQLVQKQPGFFVSRRKRATSRRRWQEPLSRHVWGAARMLFGRLWCSVRWGRLGHLHTIVYLPGRFLSLYIISVFL